VGVGGSGQNLGAWPAERLDPQMLAKLNLFRVVSERKKGVNKGLKQKGGIVSSGVTFYGLSRCS